MQPINSEISPGTPCDYLFNDFHLQGNSQAMGYMFIAFYKTGHSSQHPLELESSARN